MSQSLTPAQEAFNKGYAYQTGQGQKANLKTAQRYYKEAVKLDPSLFPALSNLALIYYGSKDYKNAKRYYTQAIKAARNSDDISHREEAKVSSDLGGCYFKEDNLPAAEKWFRAAIAFDPALVEAHYNLVNLLLKEDRREEARQELTVAAQLAPSTRYGLFEGRLRGKQNWDEWNPTWVKVLVAVVLAGLVIVPVVRWVINRK